MTDDPKQLAKRYLELAEGRPEWKEGVTWGEATELARALMDALATLENAKRERDAAIAEARHVARAHRDTMGERDRYKDALENAERERDEARAALEAEFTWRLQP